MQKTIEFPQPLTEKWRPRRVRDFIGIAKPKAVMESFLRRPYGSAWFFLGPTGTGKTSLAQAVIEELNAEAHLIPSRSCDLETIESVCRMCQFVPLPNGRKIPARGRFHAVLCDEADQMTLPAQMALLSKTDATAMPPQTIFFFTANGTASLEPRFLSRCRVLPFRTEDVEKELVPFLRRVYKAECGTYPPDFERIAREALFNIRDALGKLEVELMLGKRRANFAAKDAEVELHTHVCLKCKARWQHADEQCRLPYRSVCAPCNSTMNRSMRGARNGKKTVSF